MFKLRLDGLATVNLAFGVYYQTALELRVEDPKTVMPRIFLVGVCQFALAQPIHCMYF